MRNPFPPLASLNPACLVTSLGMLAGGAALPAAVLHGPRLALTFFFLAVLADRVDGIIARKLNQTSEFGKNLDSLADAFCFGVVPVLLFAQQGPLSPLFLTAAACHLLAAIWRLAHFNVAGLSEGTFTGIPTTVVGAAFFLLQATQLVLADHRWLGAPTDYRPPFLFASAVGMLSALKYRKNGLTTRLLTLALPIALAALWFSR